METVGGSLGVSGTEDIKSLLCRLQIRSLAVCLSQVLRLSVSFHFYLTLDMEIKEAAGKLLDRTHWEEDKSGGMERG